MKILKITKRLDERAPSAWAHVYYTNIIIMVEINYLEWIGYLGSIIVAVSLTMKSMIKLRWYNFIGALIFTIYGFAIGAMPVALVNSFITLIDLYYLYKIYSTSDFFDVLEIGCDDKYFHELVKFYKKPIDLEFPNFKDEQLDEKLVFMILRNMSVASVFVAKLTDGNLVVELDYAVPQYQDFKTGAYLFVKNLQLLRDKGVKCITTFPKSKALEVYYTKMGFIRDEHSSEVKFMKEI